MINKPLIIMTNEERLQKVTDLIDSSRDQLNQIDKLANELFEEINEKGISSTTDLELDIEYPLYLLLQPLNDTIERFDKFMDRVASRL